MTEEAGKCKKKRS